ncbi:MAG: PUR family DNA/RNA-binding protein [Bacteroidales bacterium]|nr:PUR family DNA/RNA-binding protein [Bacteroidales bacterium]MCF8402793.1 PUR family DNA/RNA-binding protein [Bacteroidales bacterium]
MEELENKGQEKVQSEHDNEQDRQEIFSKTVRAGKRTYFFDVKSTRAGEYYLTITESKRRFNNDQGKFFYEKHKLFLYKEDFEKFADGLSTTIEFIQTGKEPEEPVQETLNEKNPHLDVEFEDLGTETSDSEDTENQD